MHLIRGRRRIGGVALALMFLIGSTVPAHAHVVDDYETAPFDVSDCLGVQSAVFESGGYNYFYAKAEAFYGNCSWLKPTYKGWLGIHRVAWKWISSDGGYWAACKNFGWSTTDAHGYSSWYAYHYYSATPCGSGYYGVAATGINTVRGGTDRHRHAVWSGYHYFS